ncbi:CMD-domain-containing protein [Aspergillus heteromorphus CBS 117.55]|uniref:CMD-domain-containing protein n=1 Tax=Aspergillus heteromorphus CBS 117.55 TaxID=1448321 RepID=A0A317WP87_9EURO|nr:CMD-domain-containing protein [Aspergillus heteromorphus CBS 117.55]PWY88314.1 CMD-domain-containing protein [Aspergillus heteromorphus CBS 117.55]
MTDKPELKPLHQTLFDEGMKVRREVLGDAYVDRALANGSSEFARPGQELITEVGWGYIWTRPGLERKQRSILNLGMLIALKAWPELAVHTRGAINNGLTEKEISEAVLQATVYCGAPAGIEATKVTERVINEMIESGEYKRP